jgi:phosphohistidine phosphatase SixA
MIVFVLRHADKQRTPPNADELVTAGRERAEFLARMLADSRVSVAYDSGATRARQTLEPLKRERGSALTIRPLGTVAETVQAVKSQPADAVVAVVGHTNTVPQIIEELGGGSAEEIEIEEWEFDKLFVLFRNPTGRVTLLKLRYGAATLPCGAPS